MARLQYVHWHEGLDPQGCISVDGDAPGRLHLSHWPGNRTPERFRHDLSTGMCVKLAQANDREDCLRGIHTVTNNHWDTDGACSVFACVEPALALAHAPDLISAAAAGDFSVFTTPEGVKIDLTLTALTRLPESPVASSRFSDEHERRQSQYEYALELMPRLLANPDLHADWFAQEFWAIHQDLRALREEEAYIDTMHALDFAVVTTEVPLHEMAVNTATACDRILTVITGPGGMHQYELRLTTLSWFELVSRPYIQRISWDSLLDRLNSEAAGDGAWVGDDVSDPTPAISFLNEGQPALNATRPEVVRGIVAEHFARSPFLPAGI